MRSIGLSTLVTLMALGAGACGQQSTPSDPGLPGDPVAVVAIRVRPQSIQLSASGETRQLRATIEPANATDKAIAWESSDSAIASVGSSGQVTARAAGSGVFITASTHDGHRQASVNVTVNP